MHAATESPTPATPTTAAASIARRMRAVGHPRYGTPEVLVVEEVDRPIPGEDDVLVRVHAAGVSIGDHHVVTGKPYMIRLSPFGGLPHPKRRVPGTAMAGRVEAVGAKVTTFKPGDEVFGEAASGAFAEYALASADRIALKPSRLSFEEAAAVPWGATALQGLRVFVPEWGVTQPRQYTLSDAPGLPHFRISVKRDAGTVSTPPGRVSTRLHDAHQVGDLIDLAPPFGDFHLDEACSTPVVLISGGVGITPMISMLDRLVAAAPSRPRPTPRRRPSSSRGRSCSSTSRSRSSRSSTPASSTLSTAAIHGAITTH